VFVRSIVCIGFVGLVTACGSSAGPSVEASPNATDARESPPSTVTFPHIILPSPPASGDPAPAEPVYGSTRADRTPGSSAEVLAARTDPHNPELNKVLGALDLQHVFLRTTPAEPGGSEAWTDIYFDLKKAPYAGRLTLFAVRPGGRAIKGTVSNFTLVTVRLERGAVVGLEMNDDAMFTPDNPADIPSSVPSGD
jgi:hypothetical protein